MHNILCHETSNEKLIHVGGLCYPLSENIVEDEECTMELEYRKISEERCKEINSWEIQDPYRDGKIFTTEGKDFVTNKDESILFCRAFRPNPEFMGKYHVAYLFINNKEYHFVSYDLISYADEKSGSISVRNEEIGIFEEEFIEKSEEKKELLKLLKCLISKFEAEFCVLEEVRAMEHRFKFYYKGEEI